MTSRVKLRTTAQVQSRASGFVQTLDFLIAETISDLIPSQPLHWKNIHIPSHVKLADPGFHTPASIDGLLEAQVLWKLLCVGQIQVSTSLILQKILLGSWSGNEPST